MPSFFILESTFPQNLSQGLLSAPLQSAIFHFVEDVITCASKETCFFDSLLSLPASIRTSRLLCLDTITYLLLFYKVC